MGRQIGLFGRGEPAIDARFAGLERIELSEGAWLEIHPGWVAGHDSLFDSLEKSLHWRHDRRQMYDHVVDVPRLLASIPDDAEAPPLLEEMRAALARRYATPFPHCTLALYRDGRDSVAWHGDRVAREMDQALVATVSLGAPRRFLLRPASGGASRAFSLGGGDLFVMGGSCQRTYRHSVPKLAEAGPRMAVMFRPAWYAPVDGERSRG